MYSHLHILIEALRQHVCYVSQKWIYKFAVICISIVKIRLINRRECFNILNLIILNIFFSLIKLSLITATTQICFCQPRNRHSSLGAILFTPPLARVQPHDWQEGNRKTSVSSPHCISLTYYTCSNKCVCARAPHGIRFNSVVSASAYSSI